MTTLLELMGCEWTLERRWGGGPKVGFLLQNPSTGDGLTDDPTIKRSIMFADGWGYRALVIVNLYPIVTPHPSTCAAWRKSPDAYAGTTENYQRAGKAMDGCEWLIAGYGALDDDQGADLCRFLAETKTTARKWRCLGTTKDGWPKHPLARAKHRVPDGTEAKPYRLEIAA
jgi:hypothetical protein